MVVRHVYAGGLLVLALVAGCAPSVPARSAAEAPAVDGIVRSDGTLAIGTAASTEQPATDPDTAVQEIPVELAPESPAPTDLPTAQLEAEPEAAGVVTDDQTLVVDTATQDRVVSAVVETDGFQTVGVSWPADVDLGELAPQVRTRDADGDWTDWVDLEVSEEQPDAGSADAAHGARSGTDALWVGESDAVQLAFAETGTDPAADVRLALVSSGLTSISGLVAGATVSGDAVVSTASLKQVSSALAAPRVISRAEWSAAPQACAPDVASTLVGAVVHHTAGSNDYSTVAQAMQQIRNDQAYHINTQHWCDIGYNFIVDKWGNIYEGRANSLTQPVIGVHAGGFNTATVGVSMLGDFSTVTPSDAMRESVARIIGYRLGVYGRNPAGTMSYTTGGGENSRFAAGTTVGLPVVFAHRDTAFTACPGNAGYAQLQWIRDRARAIAFSEPLVRSLYHDMLNRGPDPTGLATWSALIMAGQPASTLGDGIARSREYVERKVTEAYAQILGRAPDGAGFEVQVQAIMNGVFRVEDLRGQLIASPEYYAQAGGNDRAYVQRLYRDILGREATPSEVEWWIGAVGRSGLAIAPYGVWRSRESAELRIHETYRIFLDRSADPTGLATWAPYWMANGDDALRAVIIRSDEYLARSLSFG
ncbi:N-acetylmuramoyl-L-alanine amidase [Cellulomonas soli]|uniref:Peptidoglycan recognition protein family domain-containing protein n=1 Tax=Cellulomonas soli TaxID=931535 RepID=A0A512P8B2_9CELL|nr:N-acetylmuramoyl-L-alanine amidase [Cellulomonas soli]NYI57585.1 hypothetical protein [Cellulomonas soli]GEP67362.1 hypothetical protein CSO01_00770 [Cellulomonas soli]